MASLSTAREDSRGSAGHRVFLALYPPEFVRREALEALVATGARLRWVDPRRLHLTLGFAGTLSGPEVTALVPLLPPLLADLADAPRLQLHGVGRFGYSVLWFGVRESSGARPRTPASSAAPAREAHWLHGLSRTIRHALLQASDSPVEQRPWVPHVTIARPSADQRAQVRVAARSLRGFTGRWWQPRELMLMESLASQRHRHVVLESFTLAAPAEQA